ncbi:mitochondrial 37S ribosomal protein mS46 RSM28 NDAI_0A07140 [Naumovozyma dairenensis CBS 421]|uniref:Uncharacterized protein n=1 Tax=Naumovozyma dairenensis (strain ATCC 10597 / BCRC 20456 / CBS 421 / NBRC 0211 / NRRL Y-12639) TaxID=1071378 RepID=G0W4Y0_NAUDC|nr:hypothetical protein NDAI_0A07140 [Naumovozyma dairenensis CBS 421]CCD22868.1 hypothetical protein NDAI_0A07140 [Naumovozyma dairenensis CBS 421]
MLSIRNSRVLYSSNNITKDFISDILAKALEATSKNPKRKTSLKDYDQHSSSANRRQFNRNKRKLDDNNRGQQRFDELPIKKLQPRIQTSKKPSFSSEFLDILSNDSKNGTTTGTESHASMENDLLNIISKTENSTVVTKNDGIILKSSIERNERTQQVLNKLARGNNNRLFKFKKRNGDNNDFNTQRNKSANQTEVAMMHSKDFVPQLPTKLSLLKYSSNLYNVPKSKITKFAMKTLNDSNFPIHRSPNLGFNSTIDPKKNQENLSLTVKHTPNFGKYLPASSLQLSKEKLFKNLSINFDTNAFNEIVLGKYSNLSNHNLNDFNKLTNSNTKKNSDLLKNSNTVKLNLEKLQINNDNNVKTLLYDVCSGLKPISEIMFLPNSNTKPSPPPPSS